MKAFAMVFAALMLLPAGFVWAQPFNVDWINTYTKDPGHRCHLHDLSVSEDGAIVFCAGVDYFDYGKTWIVRLGGDGSLQYEHEVSMGSPNSMVMTSDNEMIIQSSYPEFYFPDLASQVTMVWPYEIGSGIGNWTHTFSNVELADNFAVDGVPVQVPGGDTHGLFAIAKLYVFESPGKEGDRLVLLELDQQGTMHDVDVLTGLDFGLVDAIDYNGTLFLGGNDFVFCEPESPGIAPGWSAVAPEDFSTAILAMPNGGCLLATTDAPSYDATITRYSARGDIVWTMAPGLSRVYDFLLLDDGRILFTGLTDSDNDLIPLGLLSADGFLEHLWISGMSGYGKKLVRMPDGDVLLGASTQYTGYPASQVKLIRLNIDQPLAGPGSRAGSSISLQTFPNPFNAATTLTLRLEQPGTVQLALYDIVGRLVQQVHSGPVAAGIQRFTLDGSGLASGSYLLRAGSGDMISTHRITVIK